MPRVVAAFVVRVPPPLQVLLDLARVGVRVGVEVGVRVRVNPNPNLKTLSLTPTLTLTPHRRAQHAALCGPLVAPRGDVVPGQGRYRRKIGEI